MHEEVEVERLGLAERVDARGVRIGQQQHVGFVDGLEPANRRAVKGDAALEQALVQSGSRNREVLHDAREVAEPDVDVLDFLVLGELEDVVGRHICH